MRFQPWVYTVALETTIWEKSSSRYRGYCGSVCVKVEGRRNSDLLSHFGYKGSQLANAVLFNNITEIKETKT